MTAQDLFDQLKPSIDAREAVSRLALRTACAAVLEAFPDATELIVSSGNPLVHHSDGGYSLRAIRTSAGELDDLFGLVSDAGRPLLYLATEALVMVKACSPIRYVDGTFGEVIDLRTVFAELDGLEAANASAATVAPDGAVLKTFPLMPGIREQAIGRHEIDMDGWVADRDAFRLFETDGRPFVEVRMRPLDADNTTDTALSFGVFAPGTNLSRAADRDVASLTFLGNISIDGVEYVAYADYTED